MVVLWRISNHLTLNGRGGLHEPARWHSIIHPIVYLAESPAGAVLETLVHLELDYDDMPARYQLLKVESGAEVAVAELPLARLSDGWEHDESVTQALGDAWLTGETSALLRVPSAILPETFNVLLNPRHPMAEKVKIVSHRAHPWDRRLFR